MRGQQHRRMLKTVDEQAAEIICRVIDRPHYFVAAERADPIRRGAEEGVCDFLIVDRLKHAEATDVRGVMSVVFRIVARGDAADDFAVAPGQEKLSLAVLEEWMLLAIEKFFALDQQGRHPGRIVPVNAPGEFYEGVAIGFRL